VLEILRALLTRRLEPAHRLLLGQLVMFTGIAALFPVVPLYVRSHGGSSADIALFVAGPLVASTLVQLPAGHLVDRIGRKPVLIGSRLLYAALSGGLFLNLGPLWMLAVLRVGQGASGGAYVPALRAALADLTPPGERGHRYAQLQGCEMVGLLLGPAIGGAVALWAYSGIFAASGIAVLLGIGTVIRMPETRGTDTATSPSDPAASPNVAATPKSPDPPASATPAASDRSPASDTARAARFWWLRPALLVPSIGLAATGTMFSMYDVVWPQYLSARGYDSLVIGLSISLFAVPILLFTGKGGRLSDRADRRLLVPVALCVVAGCASTYPWLRNIFPILAVGTVEALAVMLVEPSLFAVISESTAASLRGRAMGVGGLFEAGGGAFGAGVLGALYGIAEPLPFLGGATVCLLAALVCARLLPRRHPEETSPHPVPVGIARAEVDVV
jgi:DHA1 family multidrug resistance protein-like MFS transporter